MTDILDTAYHLKIFQAWHLRNGLV